MSHDVSAPPPGDEPVRSDIEHLLHEEDEYYSREGGLDAAARARLDTIRVELDRHFDLLHQRQARRSAGKDPDAAVMRSADVVENYVR